MLSSDDADAAVDASIRSTLPSGPGERHQQVFALARALKAIPSLADAKADDLQPIVERWHALALPFITTKAFDETRIDFIRAWTRVIYPAGGGPLDKAFQRAQAADPPVEAMRYDDPAVRLLVALCRELQRIAGARPFFLSCRTAGRLLHVDHTTAWRWFYLLLHDGLLHLTEKGTKRRAARYTFRECGPGPQRGQSSGT